MKSYGRAPTFLMLTGYEQVRSVVAALAGDLEAARARRAGAAETGVCSVTPADAETAAASAGACCGAAPAPTETVNSCGTTAVPVEAAASCCNAISAPADAASGRCAGTSTAPIDAATGCCEPAPVMMGSPGRPRSVEAAPAAGGVRDVVKAKYGAAALRVSRGGTCCG